jgi:hypothetical protein
VIGWRPDAARSALFVPAYMIESVMPITGRGSRSRFSAVSRKERDASTRPLRSGSSATRPVTRPHGVASQNSPGSARAAANGFLVAELARGHSAVVDVALERHLGSSFERFEYPSTFGEERQEELSDVARRIVPALRSDGGFFNMEFVVPAEGPATIIEVNGRIASRFAPMMQASHGRSTYEALFALACGTDPVSRPGRPDDVAVSYMLRAFTDAFVESVPGRDEGVEILVHPGLRLSEQGTNDVESYRVAILYGVGETRAEALERVPIASAQAPLPARLRAGGVARSPPIAERNGTSPLTISRFDLGSGRLDRRDGRPAWNRAAEQEKA